MKRLLLSILCVSSLLYSQEGPNVNQTDGPPTRGYSKVNFYDGSGNLIYRCVAISNQNYPSTLPTPSAGTNASPAAITITAHGFDLNAKPVVKISGAAVISGRDWTGINGTWTATVTDANTITVPFDSSGSGAFTAQALVVVTLSPRLTLGQWSVQKFNYDASNNLTEALWATGATASNQACSNRTSLSYQ